VCSSDLPKTPKPHKVSKIFNINKINMKAAAYQDPSSPTQYGSDARVDVMLEEMKKRQLELHVL
jgi:hypothetical protein